MENSFRRQKHNPVELIKQYWPEADISHIEYDPDMASGDYEIIRQSGGDGTLLFTVQMIQEALIPFLNMSTFFKPNPPEDWSKVKAIHYKIGPIKHVQVFGMIRLRCSKDRKFPGLKERVRIPVISTFKMHNTKINGEPKLPGRGI